MLLVTTTLEIIFSESSFAWKKNMRDAVWFKNLLLNLLYIFSRSIWIHIKKEQQNQPDYIFPEFSSMVGQM